MTNFHIEHTLSCVWLAVSFCATILQKKTCPTWQTSQPSKASLAHLHSCLGERTPPTSTPMLYSNNEDPSKLYKRTHQGEKANKL